MKHSPGTEGKTRGKFLYWLTGVVSALVIGKFFNTGEKLVKATDKKAKPVKMLTEDGRLVEVDPSHLSGNRRHIQPDEIHTWVKRKND